MPHPRPAGCAAGLADVLRCINRGMREVENFPSHALFMDYSRKSFSRLRDVQPDEQVTVVTVDAKDFCKWHGLGSASRRCMSTWRMSRA